MAQYLHTLSHPPRIRPIPSVPHRRHSSSDIALQLTRNLLIFLSLCSHSSSLSYILSHSNHLSLSCKGGAGCSRTISWLPIPRLCLESLAILFLRSPLVSVYSSLIRLIPPRRSHRYLTFQPTIHRHSTSALRRKKHSGLETCGPCTGAFPTNRLLWYRMLRRSSARHLQQILHVSRATSLSPGSQIETRRRKAIAEAAATTTTSTTAVIPPLHNGTQELNCCITKYHQ
ncbi:hypothetical protein CABS01_15772 [Colletotrichum abscissum]|uniref:uncharacterized protein n=1 Tax=Colletotrichum abscissum TaxID=1671311 RepID=UPI0027D4EAE4|nr:uncharacterized protein CABS01_15772 [Colletotrichum abscissum]KAK1474548.1 hypothetical protein CABS01_15772 [Colletotrichum abscissum]